MNEDAPGDVNGLRQEIQELKVGREGAVAMPTFVGVLFY